MDDKYAVFKRDDGTEIDDAVVIRLKDPFAATALYTYANTIWSFIELLRNVRFLGDGEEGRLVEIADYFHNQAVQSQAITGKDLPD